MAGLAMLFIGLVLLLVPALLLPATLGVRGLAARVVAGMVTAAAVVVLATEVLSLAYGLRAGWMLLAQGVLAMAAVAAWLHADRPSLHLALPRRAQIKHAIREHPLVAGAVAFAVMALTIQAVMALAVPPNNNDSLAYHLARIAFWLQSDTALHYDLGVGLQLSGSPNGEFLQAWTISLGGWERLAALVQWASAVGLGLAVMLAARVLGFARPAAAFAASMFVLLPQPLLQATTTQNDLIVSFLLLTALVLLVRGIRDRHIGEVAFGAVALALAVGTKGTALIAGPSALIVLVAALIGYRPPRALVLRGLAIGTGAFLLLGAFNYALNVDTYGDPLGPARDATARTSPVAENAVRVGWSFVDSPAFKIGPLSTAAERVGDGLFGGVKNDQFPTFTPGTVSQEDVSSFGLFGLLIVLPLLLFVLVRPKTPVAWRVAAAASLAYVAVFALTSEENPFIGRVLIPAVAIGAPLFALLYRRSWLAAVALALAVLTAVPVLLTNQNKPLLSVAGLSNIFTLDHLTQQTIYRPDVRAAVAELDQRIGQDTPIGLVRDGNNLDYLFFGPNVSRRVVLLEPGEATPETAAAEGLGAIVFASVEPPPEADVERLGDPEQTLDDFWVLR